MSPSAISVRGLAAGFGRRSVLEGLELEVGAGMVTALLGRNGAGKTTLVRVLAGLHPRRAGSVSVLGIDPERRGAAVRAAIGHVADCEQLPGWIRVGEALRFRSAFYSSWDRALEGRLLEQFGLDRAAPVASLSRGAREKLALVGALAHRPRLLLLDEPFAGLDAAARRDVLAAVVAHLADTGGSALLVSHAAAEVERLADRIAILDGGRIAWEGDLDEARRSGSNGFDLDERLAEAFSATGRS